MLTVTCHHLSERNTAALCPGHSYPDIAFHRILQSLTDKPSMPQSGPRPLSSISFPFHYCLTFDVNMCYWQTGRWWQILADTESYWQPLTATDSYSQNDQWWQLLTDTDSYLLLLTDANSYWLLLSANGSYWQTGRWWHTVRYWELLAAANSYWQLLTEWPVMTDTDSYMPLLTDANSYWLRL